MKDILKSLLIMEGFPEDKAYWMVEDIFKQVIVEHDNGLPKDKKEALVSSGKMSREDFVTVVMRYIQLLDRIEHGEVNATDCSG